MRQREALVPMMPRGGRRGRAFKQRLTALRPCNKIHFRRRRDRNDWQNGCWHKRAHRNGFHSADTRAIVFGLRGGAGKRHNLCIGRGNDGAGRGSDDLVR